MNHYKQHPAGINLDNIDKVLPFANCEIHIWEIKMIPVSFQNVQFQLRVSINGWHHILNGVSTDRRKFLDWDNPVIKEEAIILVLKQTHENEFEF